MFFASAAIYGCNANFNQPAENILLTEKTEISNIPVKFIDANGKVAFEITENGSSQFSVNKNNLKFSNLNDQDIKSLKKILTDIEAANNTEKTIKPKISEQPVKKQGIVQSRINQTFSVLFKGVNNYLSLMKKTKELINDL